MTIKSYLDGVKAAARALERTASLPLDESELFVDDWTNAGGTMVGEKPNLLHVADVGYCRRRVISGTLVMTPYQVGALLFVLVLVICRLAC